MPKKLKQSFILNEIWMLSINAAFQRAKIYKEGSLETERDLFKLDLKDFVSKLGLVYNSREIEESAHLENIRSIISFSKKFKSILNKGLLNFGVSQKLLNLYLKYLWCLDINTIQPPHFPVDRIIQHNLKYKNLCSWTQMTDEGEYLKIINFAKLFAIEKGFKSIAELELNYFSRRKDNVKTI